MMNGLGVVSLLIFTLILTASILKEEGQNWFSGYRRTRREGEDRRVRSRVLLLALVTLGSVVFQSEARAELMWGEVQGVYHSGRTLKIRKFVPQKMDFEETRIEVPRSVDLDKISSIEELKTGDKVLVDAERDTETGKWIASFVDLSENGKTCGGGSC